VNTFSKKNKIENHEWVKQGGYRGQVWIMDESDESWSFWFEI